MTEDEVIDRFTYSRPTNEQTENIISLRAWLQDVACFMLSLPMDERCRALAITKLEEVSMWGNKGIVKAHADSES